MDLDLIEEGQVLLEVVRVPFILPERRGRRLLQLERPRANHPGLKGIHRILLDDVFGDNDIVPIGEEGQQQA